MEWFLKWLNPCAFRQRRPVHPLLMFRVRPTRAWDHRHVRRGIYSIVNLSNSFVLTDISCCSARARLQSLDINGGATGGNHSFVCSTPDLESIIMNDVSIICCSNCSLLNFMPIFS